MKFCTLKPILTLLIATQIVACVSIDLSKTDVKKAEGVTYQAPPPPFNKINSTDIDVGWRNEKNGNTITVVSDCENPYDPTLENIEIGVVSGLQNLEKLDTQEKMYNERASRQSIYSGTVDGIPSKVNLMIFKKNNCIYVLSYLTVVKNYPQNEQTFQQFLNGFHAP